MNTDAPTSAAAAIGWIQQINDTALRSGHAMLSDRRVHDFAGWMDQELDQFDLRFRDRATHRSIRKSLGR